MVRSSLPAAFEIVHYSGFCKFVPPAVAGGLGSFFLASLGLTAQANLFRRLRRLGSRISMFGVPGDYNSHEWGSHSQTECGNAMGFTSEIVNKANGKRYLISTAEDKQSGGWQTAVFERKQFGLPHLFHPDMFLGAFDRDHARQVHSHVEEIVATLAPTEWQSAKWKFVKDTLDTLDKRKSECDTDSEFPARNGGTSETFLLTLARNEDVPIDSPEFETLIREYRQEGSRDLARLGYRLRLAEIHVVGSRHLVPMGQIEEILQSAKSSQETIESIASFLDDHGTIGLGEPIRQYVLGPFDELCRAVDQLVEFALNSDPPPSDELESQTELYARLIAYGYVCKVAEDLVRSR